MAATPISTPYASASLYVGDLNPDVTEALLFEIFNAVGPVASVRVCRDAATRRSLGYAYVNFHRVEDAERALDTMNFKTIRGRPCRIMWSHRDPSLRKSGVGNIFVKNLVKTIDNKSLYDTFSMFGNILSCKVATSAKGEALGYGFVHYESEESAQNAIARVNGKVIAGQTVQVSQFKSKKERGNKYRFTNLYIKNLPDSFGTEKLKELFGKFGKINGHKVAEKEGKSLGFGFVNFEKPEEAAAAIEALNGKEIGDKKLYVARHQKRDERERELRAKFEQRKYERQKQYVGVNLFIKNLADSIDDYRLATEFSKFGSIGSAKVMTDPSSKSKGFGFVYYQNPEEATKAVTEMNGRMLDGKPLYVAIAQRKEVRRAQLEAQYAARAAKGVAAPTLLPPQSAIFYPGMQGIPQRVLYPQQIVQRARWNPQTATPQMLGVRNINYIIPNSGGGRSSAPAGRGVATGVATQSGGVAVPVARGRGTPQQPPQRVPQIQQGPGSQGPRRPPQQQQGYKYTSTARNQQVQPTVPVQVAPALPDTVVPSPVEPLTIKTLAAAPEEQKKQMIGENLFPLVKELQPELAGKITGMLLEMDNGELLHLLESRDALNEKIDEALQVLRHHDAGDEEEEEEES